MAEIIKFTHLGTEVCECCLGDDFKIEFSQEDGYLTITLTCSKCSEIYDVVMEPDSNFQFEIK